jgi:hypothetical protein
LICGDLVFEVSADEETSNQAPAWARSSQSDLWFDSVKCVSPMNVRIETSVVLWIVVS